MTDIFISYARDDDEPFVKRLYEDLTARGFEVWWDRVSMPSRALTFLQEIRDAIDSADRLILVVGPKAVESDYVSAEWQYALRACKVVTPILRLGDYDLLPDNPAKFHCPDFRPERPYDDALAELLRILAEPIPSLGALPDVPSLPTHFLPRPEEMAPLAETILADVKRPTVITSAKQTTALQGMGGVGKSVLAAAFARACETRRAFTDGVIWLTFGQQPDLVCNLALVGQAFDDDPQHYLDLPRGKARLAEVLADKVCLLVLDDIWDVTHAEAFANALGARCRMLITTRDGGLATALGAQEHRLDVLSDDAALKLLADWSEQAVDSLPPEARAVADECGNLPLALALCGAMARDGTPWTDLLDALREADLTFLEVQFPNYPYPNAFKSLKVGVDALARIDPAWEKHYLELAVFPADEAVPEAAVMTLWLHTDGLNEREARKLLTTLERKALVRLEGEAPQRRVTLHNLQHDYLRAAQGDLTSLHGGLLEAYRQKCKDGWPTGPDDGYFFQHLAYHLLQVGRGEELQRLLFDFGWLRAKLDATDVNALIADYDFLADDPDLRLVQGAIRLAAHVLAQDRTQLRCQLYGRLLSFETPRIQALLEQIKQWEGTLWLRSLTLGLAHPVDSLLCTLVGHTEQVQAVALTPDGTRAISASVDFTLKVWDLSAGTELFTLMGHTNVVTAVAVTPDGKRAVSASGDCTLRIWDLERGKELRTLTGHTAPVTAVVLTPDGEQAVSGSVDGTLRVWDLASGKMRTLQKHNGEINAVVIIPGGERVISASRDSNVDITFKVWDLASGKDLLTLHSHHHFQFASPGDIVVTVTPDGKRALSMWRGGWDITVWDLENGRELKSLSDGLTQPWTVAAMPNGKTVVSASRQGILTVWDLTSNEVLRAVRGHGAPVLALAVSEDEARIVSASYDHTLKVWDLIHRTAQGTEQVHGDAVLAPKLGADLILGILKGTEQVHGDAVLALRIAPDGKRVLSASRHGIVRIWDLENGKELSRLGPFFAPMIDVAMSQDGKRVIFASPQGPTISIWELDTGGLYHTGGSLQTGFREIALAPDGDLAVAECYGGLALIRFVPPVGEYLLRSGNEFLYAGHGGNILSVAITPDGKIAVSASEDGTIKVWDLKRGKEMRTLRGHSDAIHSVTVTPDGERALSSSRDQVLKVWDLETGKALRTWNDDSGSALELSMTPDGRIGVSTHWPATVKVWDLLSGKIITWFSCDETVEPCAVAPDGMTIVVGTGLGQMQFLRLEGVE